MDTAIIIPALNPDQRLIDLVQRLRKISGSAVVIVDDGSNDKCRNFFEQLATTYNCEIVCHKVNMGKGAALKTGIRYVLNKYPELLGIVTADADGQHLPQDIVKIVDAIPGNCHSFILGVRDFSADDVPFKSRWGNRITSIAFYLYAHIYCEDTQTGLRGIPSQLAHFCLSVPGDRFEYEMNVLTAIAKKKVPFKMIPISTVYFANNSSTHFHPVWDSLRIYLNIIKFSLSSLIGAATDLTLFTLLTCSIFGRTSAGIFAATIVARCIAGIVNFALNKKWSFGCHGNGFKQAVKYFMLFVTLIFLSWAGVTLLSYLPINLTLLKILTDSGLFLFSYYIQNKYIFKKQTQVI